MAWRQLALQEIKAEISHISSHIPLITVLFSFVLIKNNMLHYNKWHETLNIVDITRDLLICDVIGCSVNNQIFYDNRPAIVPGQVSCRAALVGVQIGWQEMEFLHCGVACVLSNWTFQMQTCPPLLSDFSARSSCKIFYFIVFMYLVI